MIFRLRQQIFILEQECLFPEIDQRDPLAWHLLGFSELDQSGEDLVSYCRIFAPGDRYDEACLSRVVVREDCRQAGTGRDLMVNGIKATFKLFGPTAIRLAAQKHLEGFYAQVGFQPVGPTYLEDNILHQDMLRPANAQL